MRTSIALIGFFVLLTPALSACGGRRARASADTTPVAVVAAMPAPLALVVTRPETQIGVDGANVLVRMRVVVANPNPYAVTAHALDGVLYLDGAQVATAHIDGAASIAARTEQFFQIDASVPLRVVMSVRSRVYTTSGAVMSSAPDGTAFRSPFSFDGPLPAF